MQSLADLLAGHRRFLDERYPHEAALYTSLAQRGQAPKIMIIACCDSRAAPATIFQAGPGQLFVVRNVANLVPPAQASGDYMETRAALEFAVMGLSVETIVVMGHADCGGVRFCLGGREPSDASEFTKKWTSLIDPARDEVMSTIPGSSIEEQRRALELASLRYSLANLRSYRTIDEREKKGLLSLHALFFDISSGQLMKLDEQTERFEQVRN